MNRLLLLLAGCSAAATSHPVGQGAPETLPNTAPVSGASMAASQPVITTRPPSDPSCPLHWDELHVPARIPLQPVTANLADDECPVDFDPSRVLAGDCAQPDCMSVTLPHDRRGAFVIDGPNGSGRFWFLGLAVEGAARSYACISASSVGWRHLGIVGGLAPLPWFEDLDGDGDREIIAWQRLPWGRGMSERDNAIVPIAYSLEGDALVRIDSLASKVAAKVAQAYRTLIANGTTGPEDRACYNAVATALDAWGR